VAIRRKSARIPRPHAPIPLPIGAIPRQAARTLRPKVATQRRAVRTPRLAAHILHLNVTTLRLAVRIPHLNVTTLRLAVHILHLNVATPRLAVHIPHLNVATPRLAVHIPHLNVATLRPAALTLPLATVLVAAVEAVPAEAVAAGHLTVVAAVAADPIDKNFNSFVHWPASLSEGGPFSLLASRRKSQALAHNSVASNVFNK